METYIIYGTPQQQERPRATTIAGRIRLYDPPASKKYKAYLQQELIKNYTPKVLTEPLQMTLNIFVPIPKSYSKKKTQDALNGVLRPAKKPDVSNYVKLIEDALNGYLYKDDSQIVELHASKYYSDTPRIEITLKAL